MMRPPSPSVNPPCMVCSPVMSRHIFDISHEEDLIVDDSSLLVVPSLSPSMISSIHSSTTTTTTTMTTRTLSSVHPLDVDCWLTRSITSDEFERFLVQEAAHHNPTATNYNNVSAHQLCKEEEVELADLEDFLATAAIPISPISASAAIDASASSPSASASAASATKKRGRPAKPAPATLLTAVANKKASSPIPMREMSPEDPTTDKYLKMRRSNNEASMKSRLRRKEREAQNAQMVEKLVSENALLREQLASLRSEFAQLKSILDKHL